MPSNNCVFKCCVLLFISITLTQISKTHTTCIQSHCNISECFNPIDCLHGYVDDDCHCCKVCLKQRGEPCGPNIGKCVKGLKCLSSQHLDPVLTNSVISDKQIGICGVLNCTGVKCQNTGSNDNIKCQNDSYKLLSSDSDSCCQTTCVCLPGICNTSQTRCPHNMIARVVRAGDGKPGSCCDQIECIDAPTKCIHNNNEYMNGHKWKSDKCTTCECRDGLTFCQKKECKAITDCNAMAVINDECCPTCHGCISSKGMFYNNTHDWYENDCTHCECNNGKINCKVQMCGPIHCDHPITVAGQCCPICSNQSKTCDIQCSKGYKVDSSGKDICECNVCPNTYKCKIYCPFGFKKGTDGCELCECLVVDNHLKQYKNVNKEEDKSCITNNGTVIPNDLFWNDGCRECYCNSGKIMCTKPNCPHILCSNTILIEGKCCAVCADNPTNDKKSPIGTPHIHSPFFITVIILTLIIAILLLGIFILLAIYIMKKYPHFKYQRNRVINGSVKENTIFHLWPFNQSSPQLPKTQEKQFISIRVANDNKLNDSLQIEDVGHSLQEKLLTTCTCPH